MSQSKPWDKQQPPPQDGGTANDGGTVGEVVGSVAEGAAEAAASGCLEGCGSCAVFVALFLLGGTATAAGLLR